MNDYKFKTKPFQHQLDWFTKTRDREYFAVFWEMGAGKSKLAIDTMAWLYSAGKIGAVLIVANKGSYMNWNDAEIPRHMPDHIKYSMTYWDSGAGKKHQEECERVCRGGVGLRILIMNVEAMAFDRGRKFAERFAISAPCLCIIDESTSIKNPKALRTKAMLKMRKLFAYRRVMTGSPVSNGPLNLYSQAEFLGDWLLGHSSFYSYRNEYCKLVDMTVNNRSFKRVVGYRNLEKLKGRMAQWSSVLKKEDCLDLPPKIYQTYEVDLTPEQKRVYQQLKEDSIAQLSQSIVTVELALTKLLRLQQVVCGFVPDAEGKIVEFPDGRLSALLELADEAQGQVIIWSRFVRDIRRIVEALKKEYGPEAVVTYYGETSHAERREAVERFQAGQARFFVGNQQTGGYGITLTAATTVIYYSNLFDLEPRVQSEDRCHRPGQTKSVTYVDIKAPGTVDDKIIKALRDKVLISDVILGGNWRELLE